MKKPFNRRNFIKFTSLAAMGSAGFLQGAALPEIKQDLSEPLPLISFSTGGYSVYHLKPATVTGNLRAIVSASFDGTILCHTPNGDLLWKNQSSKDFPFDLAVADINNDGLDEIFVATAGGTLIAFNPDGTHLWTYTSKAPLYQVCPIKTSSGEWRILTGGVEEEVFALSSSGSPLSSYKAGDVVRHIRKGDILGDGKEYAAIATTSSGLSGKLSLVLLDPSNMQQLWRITNLGVSTANSGRRFFSMVIMDLNNDGKQEIVLSASWGDNGLIYGFNQSGQKILETTSTSVPRIPYRMSLLSHVKLKDSDKEYIFGLWANMLIVYNGNGTFNTILTSKYDFSNAAFDPQSNTYYLGSSPSGGDGIYALNLNHAGWASAFGEIKPVGTLAKIENNIALLNEQISRFEKPAYQRSPGDIMLVAKKPTTGAARQNLHFTPVINFTENYGNRSELWCKSIDSRYPYNLTAEQILTTVRQKEASMEYFTLLGGHSDAMYMRPSTMAAILLAAPIYFQGFIFTEMEKVDADMQRIVQEILFPLAQQCSKAGKKIIFQNKNIFWNGSCYRQFWRDLLLNPTFSDVFVPGLEETNCRTQELSLAGRLGLWMTGSFDKWSDRAVTDDACFDRMWEWSSQQVLSHYLRKMVLRASLGADIFSIDIFQGTTLSSILMPQLYPFYDMLAKGVVAIPKREELLSVSDLCLGMKSPPSEEYLNSGINGHSYNFPYAPSSQKVFDRLDCYWGGAPLLDHDISKYGYGTERRMLNFLPKTPYGMITIVPDNIDIKEFPWIHEKVTTDGSFFFDENNTQIEAVDHKPVMLAKLQEAAGRLPVLVKGDAAWSIVRLDPEHVRITLIDPGYTDPADREVEIVLQHLIGMEAVDILSGETLTITNQSFKVNIPAGIFRIIDIRHEIVTSVKDPDQGLLKVYPNPSSGEITLSMEKTTKNLNVSIFDIAGQTLIVEEVKANYGSFNKTYLLPPQKGLYLINITGDGISYSEKIIRM